MAQTTQECMPAPSQHVDYALNRETVSSLTAELLSTKPPEGGGRFVCYLFDGDDRFSNLGRTVEREVFESAFANNANVMVEEYGAYELQSSFFVVIDQKLEQPAGALRVIKNGPEGLKTLNDIRDGYLHISPREFQEHHRVDNLDSCQDIGTVAVLKEYRKTKGRLVSNMLYRAMHTRALHEDIDHYVSIIDVRARKIFDLLGIPFEPIMDSKPFSYLGSEDSSAMYGDAHKFISGVADRYAELKKKHPLQSIFFRRYAGRLALGKGIDRHLQFDT